MRIAMQECVETGRTTLEIIRTAWKVWRISDYKRWLDYRVAELSECLDTQGAHGQVALTRQFDSEAARWAITQRPQQVKFRDEAHLAIQLIDAPPLDECL